MTEQATKIEVFYVDAANGWATAEFDANGAQIGEAAYDFHKSRAVTEAREISGGIVPIEVFDKSGKSRIL